MYKIKINSKKIIMLISLFLCLIIFSENALTTIAYADFLSDINLDENSGIECVSDNYLDYEFGEENGDKIIKYGVYKDYDPTLEGYGQGKVAPKPENAPAYVPIMGVNLYPGQYIKSNSTTVMNGTPQDKDAVDGYAYYEGNGVFVFDNYNAYFTTRCIIDGDLNIKVKGTNNIGAKIKEKKSSTGNAEIRAIFDIHGNVIFEGYGETGNINFTIDIAGEIIFDVFEGGITLKNIKIDVYTDMKYIQFIYGYKNTYAYIYNSSVESDSTGCFIYMYIGDKSVIIHDSYINVSGNICCTKFLEILNTYYLTINDMGDSGIWMNSEGPGKTTIFYAKDSIIKPCYIWDDSKCEAASITLDNCDTYLSSSIRYHIDSNVININGGRLIIVALDNTDTDSTKEYWPAFNPYWGSVKLNLSEDMVYLAGDSKDDLKKIDKGVIFKTRYTYIYKECNVTYHMNDGLEDSKDVIPWGEKLAKPNDPSRGGYIFAGWYADKDYINEFKFDNIIKDDVDIYAKWIPVTCNVKYDYLYNDIYKEMKVNSGGLIPKVDDPVRDEYVFLGWYTDKECTKKCDFDTKLSNDITLYAGWSLKDYAVNIEITGKGKVTTAKGRYAKGENVTLTISPEEKYTLVSISSEQVTINDNQFVMPNKDVLIKAVFEEKKVNFDLDDDEEIDDPDKNKDDDKKIRIIMIKKNYCRRLRREIMSLQAGMTKTITK